MARLYTESLLNSPKMSGFNLLRLTPNNYPATINIVRVFPSYWEFHYSKPSGLQGIHQNLDAAMEDGIEAANPGAGPR